MLFKQDMTQFKSLQQPTIDTIRNDKVLKTGWYFILNKKIGVKRKLDKDTTIYYLDSTPILTAKNIIKLEIYKTSSGIIGLSMKFDKIGTKAWSVATEKATDSYLAFIMDDKLLTVPRINDQIISGVSALNRGQIYTEQELLAIKKVIEEERNNFQ